MVERRLSGQLAALAKSRGKKLPGLDEEEALVLRWLELRDEAASAG